MLLEAWKTLGSPCCEGNKGAWSQSWGTSSRFLQSLIHPEAAALLFFNIGRWHADH